MNLLGIPIDNIATVLVHGKDINDNELSEWKKERLGKFTASLVGTLIGKSSNEGVFTQGAMTYIRNVAGEIVTGKTWQKEFFTTAMDWGNAHEFEAINWYCETTGMPYIPSPDNSSHRLIINDKYSACTPDALILPNKKNPFSKDNTRLLAFPLEVKCPPTFANFIEMYYCNSPQELKEVNKNYYWQHICQILFCNSFLRGGNFLVYHPDFKKKGKIIEFNPTEIKDDLIFLKDTLTHATKKLIEIVNYLS